MKPTSQPINLTGAQFLSWCFLCALDKLAFCRENSLANGQSNKFVTGAKIDKTVTDNRSLRSKVLPLVELLSQVTL